MKASLLLTLGLLLSTATAMAGEVNYSNSADLPGTTTQIKLDSAHYKIIPTKVRIERIPGCIDYGEASSYPCTREVVVESEPVVQAQVSYKDSLWSGGDGDNGTRWLTLNFRLSDFSADDVAALKAAYPQWKHPFSKAPKWFAARNLDLAVCKESRTIKVVDVRRSKLCPIGESGEPAPGCREHIVYKEVQTTVKEVTVNLK